MQVMVRCQNKNVVFKEYLVSFTKDMGHTHKTMKNNKKSSLSKVKCIIAELGSMGVGMGRDL